VRSKVELFHSKWYDEAKTVASKVNVEPSISRRARHQAHRVNSSPNEYYKCAVTIPFLYHLLSEMNNRFDKNCIKKCRK